MKATTNVSGGEAIPAAVRRALNQDLLSPRAAAWMLAIWTVVGLLTTQFGYLALHRSGVSAEWSTLLRGNLFSVWLWAVFTPGMAWLAWRFPVRGRDVWRSVAPHVLACIAFAIADVLIERAVALVIPLGSTQYDLVGLFLRRFFVNSLCYVTVVAIATVIAVARESREREAAAVRLSRQLAEARLQALQTQLRPHFLFNTLNMIAEQVHVDPDGADRMIGRLSHLLRVSLSAGGQQEVPLDDELTSLQSYLDIMSERLSGRVRFELHIDPDCGRALVPSLLLQPLAENAFRHGLEASAANGLIAVSAMQHGEDLLLEVADSGRGFDPAQMREGTGLRLVRERLAELYGADKAGVHLRPRVGGGTIAAVRLPYRVTDADASPAPDLALAAEHA